MLFGVLYGVGGSQEEASSETGSEGGETETAGRRGDNKEEGSVLGGEEGDADGCCVGENATAGEEKGGDKSEDEEPPAGGEEEEQEEGRAHEATSRKKKRKIETEKGDATEEEEEERASSESSASEEEEEEDEEEEEESEEEEGERGRTRRHGAKRSNKRKAPKRKGGGRSSRSGSKDTASSRRKRRRGGVTAFLDVEAQEGDDEEDEEGEDVLDFSEEAAQAARLAAQAAERRGGGGAAGGQQQRRGGAGHLENAIDSLVRRYQDQTFEEGEEEEEEDDLLEEDADGFPGDEDASEGILLPDITDPKLWMVKLNKTGVEREVCISILNKSFQQQESGRDLDIFSCYASDDLKGYIYVEAHSQYAIKEALHGLRLVRTHGEIRIVPLEEMPAVFNSVRSQMPCIPQRNDFVRVKRGLYANDVAQIHQVEEQGMVVTVRLIPRVDYNSLLDREKRGEGGRGRKKEELLAFRRGFAGGVMRVQKRLFDREEIDARGGQVEQGILPGTVRFAGMTFEESGYLLRRMPMRHLLVGSAAAPSLAEITEFLQGQQGVNAEELREECQRPLSCFLKRRRRAYRLGEPVRIIKGELQGSRGRIGEQQQEAAEEEDAEEAVEIVLADKSLGSVMLPISYFVKDLQVGENVRAIGGVNAGHSGLITSIDSDKQTATVFSPTAGHLFTCGLESLTLAPDAALGEEGLSSVRGFHVGDFVELTSGERGVLVFIDKNRTSIRLLLPSNAALAATAAQLAMRRSTDSLTSLDALRLPLEKGSSVVLLNSAAASSSSCGSYFSSLTASGSASPSLMGNAAGISAAPHSRGLLSSASFDQSSLLLSSDGISGAAAAAGRVLHIWRDRVYVRLTGRRENAGIVAVDAKHLRLSGGAAALSISRAPYFSGSSGGNGVAAGAAAAAHYPMAAELGASPQRRGVARAFRGAFGSSWTRSKPPAALQIKRNPYLGKLVKILRGRHKGLMATVRRVEYNELRVMLQTKELELKISMGDVQLVESARDYQSLVGRLAATPPPAALFPFAGSSEVSTFSSMNNVFAAAAGGSPPTPAAGAAAGFGAGLMGRPHGGAFEPLDDARAAAGGGHQQQQLLRLSSSDVLSGMSSSPTVVLSPRYSSSDALTPLDTPTAASSYYSSSEGPPPAVFSSAAAGRGEGDARAERGRAPAAAAAVGDDEGTAAAAAGAAAGAAPARYAYHGRRAASADAVGTPTTPQQQEQQQGRRRSLAFSSSSTINAETFPAAAAAGGDVHHQEQTLPAERTLPRTLTPIISSAACIPPPLRAAASSRTAQQQRVQQTSDNSNSSSALFHPEEEGATGFDGVLATDRQLLDTGTLRQEEAAAASTPRGAAVAKAPIWCRPGVVVRVIAGSGAYQGQMGVVGQVLPQDDQLLCHVYIGEEELIAIAVESLTPVKPERPDPLQHVLILDSECAEFGRTGVWLQAISEKCCIVRCSNGAAGEVMCDPTQLVVYQQPPQEDE